MVGSSKTGAAGASGAVESSVQPTSAHASSRGRHHTSDLATFSTPGLDVYFQSARTGVDGQLTARLVDFIDKAQQSIDCAIYDLRDTHITAALARALANGKQIRIAFDNSGQQKGGATVDPKPNKTEQTIAAAGLIHHTRAIAESGIHLMHNKFVVRDRNTVWTGSANFTCGGLQEQDNNCLVISSPEIASRYTTYFEALFTGPHSHKPILDTSFAIAAPETHGAVDIAPGLRLSTFFTPVQSVALEQASVALLHSPHRVRVIAFLVSDPSILAALQKFAADPHFDIRGIYDRSGMQDVLRSKKSDPSTDPNFWFMRDPRFVEAPSLPFSGTRENNFMHNKVMIINDNLVISGSYNFSKNAQANDENQVIIESQAVAAAYNAYFDHLYTAYQARKGRAYQLLGLCKLPAPPHP